MPLRCLILFALMLFCLIRTVPAQVVVTARIELSDAQKQQHAKHVNAVLWLEPLGVDLGSVPWPARGPYRLVQKARTFTPHILVVPVGASVAFPNEDPFYHNVFSLFEGSRFDLGLYEAGSTKDVRFARRGISYIFCNIHPEMGAVVFSLDTPLWALSNAANAFSIGGVPEGSYEAHLWVEGQNEQVLAAWKHVVSVPHGGVIDAGSFHAAPLEVIPHKNKFGQPYPSTTTTY